MASPGGMDAVTRQSNALSSEPITATSFKPTPVPPPRAWQRVAVPSAGHTRPRKIWKRVGAVPANSLPNSYVSTMTELESQGDVARKRIRAAQYIPVFGEVAWDVRYNNPVDGERDLIEARAAVSAAMEAAATSASGVICDNDGPMCIPRKRHNTRWPIEPKTTISTRQLADLQPLIEFEVPSAAAPVEHSQQVDEKQMRRRSTRRLSRRISLAPGEESAQKLGTVSLSPTKPSVPILSPTKRAPATLSSTRVAESPRRLFKVDIPSRNLVLESPKTSPPAKSPCKLSPGSPMPEPSSIDARLVAADQATHLDPSPLLFDQPLPAVQLEPHHETRRRISLLSARRSDRRSSGALRLADFETVREAPSRRHSFALEQSAPADMKSRRNTLDMFSDKPDEARITFGQDDGHEAHTTNANAKDQAILPSYEVDVGTNLDIFGQARKPKAALVVTEQSVGADASTADLPPVTVDEGMSAEIETLQSSPAQENHMAIEMSISASTHDLDVAGVAAEIEAMGVDQAATSSSPDARVANDADCLNPSLDPPLSPAEVGDSRCIESEMETSQPDFDFGPHDPEGLSTIYEEESSMAVSSPQPTSCNAVEATADSGLSSVDDASHPDDGNNWITKMDASEPARMAQLAEEGPSSASNVEGLNGDQESPSSESSCRDAMELPEKHVVPAVDVLSTSDSPLGTLGSPAVKSEAQDVSSPSNSDTSTSIVPAEKDFCGTLPLSIPTKDPNSPTSSNHHSDAMDIDDTNAEPQTTGIPVLPPTSHSSDISTPDRPFTPSHESSKDLMVPEEEVDPLESPHSESSGFTPINGRQISPTSSAPTTAVVEVDNVEAESGEVEIDGLDQEVEDEFMGVDDEPTTTVDDDFTFTVVGAPKPDNDTLTLHDDAEFVRDFVSRVTAGKNAKAAAAAAAVGPPRKVGRPKRRSGSTGSTTTSTGSPVPKSDTPARKPLREKSLNTPSPLKKRKAPDAGDNDSGEREDKKNTPEDAAEGPKLKRRRKRAEPGLEAEDPADSPSEPDANASTAGPRRSTRARSTRITLKSAPSANSIAMSMYPVRLAAGMAGMMDESVMDSHLTVSKYRSEAKELEAVTRGNTRANKAGAVAPNVVLARLAQDPAAWRMKELKGVFDAKESRTASDDAAAAASDGRQAEKAKAVRWDEELVRYQTDGTTNRVYKTMARSLLADIMSGDGAGEDDEDELSMPLLSPEVSTETAPAPAPTPIKKQAAPLRRTRSSKLQVPTPVKKLAAGEKKSSISPPSTALPAKAASSAAKATTAKKTLPTPTSAKSAKSASSTRSGMSTRRTKIASLGMGVNGTPAPKRRGRPAASAPAS